MAFYELANRAESTVSTTCLIADDHVHVAGGSVFPASGNFPVTIFLLTGIVESNIEICLCTARTGNDLTITRAQEGTSAAEHAVGEKVELRTTKGLIDNIKSTLQAEIDSDISTHAAAADPHTGYVLESLFDANSVIAATSDNTPAVLTVGEQTVVGRITSGNIAALTVAQLQMLILSAALPENVIILLDPALSADEKYSGIAETGTAGATLAFGEICYLAAADQRWELAKANAAATSNGKLGICIQAAAGDGSATTMLLYGKVREDTAYAWTINAPVFVSAATAGAMTNTAPSGTTNFVVRIVGYGGITADELFFCPDNTYLELV